MEKTIPEGTKVFKKGVFIASTNTDLSKGDLPKSKDFTPEIDFGTKLEDLEFFYQDKLIYKHPNFI